MLEPEGGFNFQFSGASNANKRRREGGNDDRAKDHLGDSFQKVSKYELNPHFKNNGSGLPDASAKESQRNNRSASNPKKNAWTAVKVNRLLEAAQKSGKSVEELAVQQYGSFDEFRRMADEAGIFLGIDSRKKAQGKSVSVSEKVSVMRGTHSAISGAAGEAASSSDLNRLQADALRASMNGDEDLSKKLQQQFDEARVKQEKSKSTVLSFKDDEDDITSMLLKERTSKRSFDEEYAKKVSKDSRFDDSLDYLDDNAAKLGSSKHSSSKAHMGKQRETQECWYCLNEDEGIKVPVIACGYRAYLGMFKSKGLVFGHSIIAPIEHHGSMLECGDEEWTEIRNFQKCLIRAFHSFGKGVIFYETNLINIKSKSRHAMIECVPIPLSIFDQAKMYFKNAIMSSDEEWSMNKKLIVTNEKGGPGKPFSRSLVPSLSYFHVWFGLDEGYGHHIENEDLFPREFGREVLSGMLNMDRKGTSRREVLSDEQLDEEKRKFMKFFKEYDWTAALD